VDEPPSRLAKIRPVIQRTECSASNRVGGSSNLSGVTMDNKTSFTHIYNLIAAVLAEGSVDNPSREALETAKMICEEAVKALDEVR
jgi:hypothetical protein